MLQEVPAQVARAISGLHQADKEAVQRFQREIANGGAVYPAGAHGAGLYPNEWAPLVQRAADCIRNARRSGIFQHVVAILHFPTQDDFKSFITESLRTNPQLQALQLNGNWRDPVAVLFGRS